MSDALEVARALREDGFAVLPGFFPAQTCDEMLDSVLHGISRAHFSGVLAPHRRFHTPLLLDRVSVQAIGSLAGILTHPDIGFAEDTKIVEMSSITVFPGAAPQPLHPDHKDPRLLVTCFINLAPTHKSEGALMVVPGSHLDKSKRNAHALEVPAGTAVLMDGRCLHAGAGNASSNAIRAVYYFSVGPSDIDGPTYSILAEDRGAYALSNFLPLMADAVPRLTSALGLVRNLLTPSTVQVLDFARRGKTIFELEDVGPEVGRLLGALEQGTGSTVEALAERCAIAPEEAIEALQALASLGCVHRA